MLRLPATADPDDFSPSWAFGTSTGAGVRVAVIDSGIDADHPFLGDSIDVDGGVEFAADSQGTVSQIDGAHRDVYGHGTACAGIIHALAPGATITSVRVLDEGLRGRAAAFHAGLSWAVDREFDVINLSLGAAKRDWALAFHDTCDRGYFNNSFIVTAANNIHRDSFPSLYASVTSVASNSSNDPLRFHFNPEPPTEFLARGIDVEVPWLDGTTIVTTGNSFAAPHIAGLAALIKANHPELRPFQIKTALWAASANVREASLDDRPRHPVERFRVRPRSSGDDADSERDEIQELLDDYDVGQLVARGPWGPVYAATKDGADVALRRLDPALAADDTILDRFVASVRIAAGLRHPHVLPILELREAEYFAVVAMPLCPSNLALDLEHGPLPVTTAIVAAVSLLRGLHIAHAAGIYHGDLRPENALIDDQQRVLLSDVGIAAALTSDVRTNAAPDDPASWAYLAPEQIEGGAIGAFTDIHAVGLVLFELLTGHLPYDLAQGPALGERRSVADLDPALPSAVVELTDRAIAPEASNRHHSANGLANDLVLAAADAFGLDWATAGAYRLAVP